MATVAAYAIVLADRFFLGLWWFFWDAADGRGTVAFADILRHRPFAFAGALGFLQRRTYAPESTGENPNGEWSPFISTF